jgi:hypothetical protein
VPSKAQRSSAEEIVRKERATDGPKDGFARMQMGALRNRVADLRPLNRLHSATISRQERPLLNSVRDVAERSDLDFIPIFPPTDSVPPHERSEWKRLAEVRPDCDSLEFAIDDSSSDWIWHKQLRQSRRRTRERRRRSAH